MDRNREARRASIVGSNGFNRRRHRTNSLRDSPDEEGGMELQESVRLRDRVKKDRDRERDRDRDRERERERERERDSRERSCRSKRRRGERLTSNREDIGGDDTSEEESLNDDEDDEDEENTTSGGGGGGGVRLLTQAVGSVPNHQHQHHSHSSSFSQLQNSNTTSNTVSSNHLHHRKSFLPNPSSAKISRAPPVWKTGDEMIGAPVPRKARSASTKRSHDWISVNSGGGVPGVEQNPGQASNSPARQGVVPTSTPTPPAPMSPTSPNASIRKKPKPTVNNSGPKLKPPKVAAKPSSSNPEELEIEIAEVLFGLMTQSQAPIKKEDSREINRLSSDEKSRNSSVISSPAAANNLSFGSAAPLSAVAPKRKRPRQIPENPSYGARCSSTPAKPDVDQNPKSEALSLNREKNQGSAAENGYEMAANPADPQAPPSKPSTPTVPGPGKMDSELKPAPEESKESRDSVAREERKKEGSPVVRAEVRPSRDSPAAPATKANATSAEMENRKEEKFEIDLMAPPPQGRPSPRREVETDFRNSPVDQKPVVSIADAQLKPSLNDEADENGNCRRENGSSNLACEEKKGEEVEKKERSVDLRIDLGKSETDGGDGFNATGNGNESQPLTQKQLQQMPHSEKSGHSFPLPMSMASWPGGLPPMGYMAPLQGVVSVEGDAVIPPLFPQPRPKRCATHCHIARNIHYLQQFTKMNPPFWPAPAGFGSKNVNGQNIPNHVLKENKGSQPASANSDSSQKKQQILIQQSLPPPVGTSNLMGPTLIFPINQQQSGAPQPSGGAKSPNMGPNEMQYLAILQNNGYTFPIPAGAVGAPRGGPMAQAMPLFNGSFYSPEMMHQLQTNQNACTSSGSSTSQKQQQHLQSHQQRMQSISSQQSHHNNQYVRPRHHESELGPDHSPSRTDCRGGSRPSMNMYGQNFAMPIHPQNLGLMTLASTGADKKQGGSKTGPDSSLPPAHSYAMSFGAMNGLGMEMAQNHAALFQNSSDITRHKMAAAPQKNLPVSDDGSKSGGVDSSSATEDKRTGKAMGGGGRSIAFTRSDLADGHASSSSMIESSTPSLNAAAAAPRSSRPMSTSNVGPMNLQHTHAIQAQLQQQHMLQQQFKQHQQQQRQQQQQQMVANASRSKVAGDMYSEHCSKFPSGFPQNLVQSNSSSSPSQSPQWKASTPQTSSSLASSNSTMLKHLPQHHSRTQISFGGSQKPLATAASQGQLHPNNNQTVESPTTSKGGASVSPRTSSTTNKALSLSEQLPNQNSPSILGNPHVSAAASSGSGQKPQIQQQSQHQMMKALLQQQQQQQLLYPNPYAQSQPHHLAGKSMTTSGASGYYMARKQKDQHQQSPGAPVTSAGPGGLSLGTNTNDPATAIAAATANVKGVGLPSQGIIHASQFAGGRLLPAGFSYAHAVPAAQGKPAEQKQSSGNEKLHRWHAEKK